MQWTAVPAVLGVDDWLAEELPELRRFDDSQWGRRVRFDVVDDHLSEQFQIDEFDQTAAPERRITDDFADDLSI